MDNYKTSMKYDLKEVQDYYSKSIIKTEQQKYLEKLLLEDENFLSKNEIADIACGGGTLSYHLSFLSKESHFTLVDYMEESLITSKEIHKDNLDKVSFQKGDIYKLNFSENQFDFTFCWQTLSWLEAPENALLELVRITKPGGKIYISSLFNLEHDVDIYSKVYDRTRNSGKKGEYMFYNTYSYFSVLKWLENKVQNFKIHKFDTNIEFFYNERGLGTFTKKCEDGLLQISGGILMNWGILEIEV